MPASTCRRDRRDRRDQREPQTWRRRVLEILPRAGRENLGRGRKDLAGYGAGEAGLGQRATATVNFRNEGGVHHGDNQV